MGMEEDLDSNDCDKKERERLQQEDEKRDIELLFVIFLPI